MFLKKWTRKTKLYIKLRKFIAETSMEFYEWAEDLENLPRNRKLGKTEYYTKFIEEYQDFKRYLRVQTFIKWADKYCKFKGVEYSEGNTQGERWFMISNENNLNEEEDEDIMF